MAGTNPETLAFLAPGLLHTFGNLWLSIDGQASLLDGAAAEDCERARTAILGATREGRACLDVMRFLAGEPASHPRAVGRVLHDVLAVARVPLRERQQTIDLRPLDAVAEVMVDPADVVVMTTETIRWLADSLPGGSPGTLVVETSFAVDGAIQVDVSVAAAPGTLPFPVATAALAALGAMASTCRGTVDCAPCRAGLSLRFREASSAVRPGSFR